MPNGEIISKDTFVKADDETFRGLLHDMLHGIYASQQCMLTDCVRKHDVIDKDMTKCKQDFANRKITDKAFAGATGFIGGFVAVLAKTLFK
jgi:hypothetical protein